MNSTGSSTPPITTWQESLAHALHPAADWTDQVGPAEQAVKPKDTAGQSRGRGKKRQSSTPIALSPSESLISLNALQDPQDALQQKFSEVKGRRNTRWADGEIATGNPVNERESTQEPWSAREPPRPLDSNTHRAGPIAHWGTGTPER